MNVILKFAHYLQEAGYKVTIFSASFLQDRNVKLVKGNKKFEFIRYGEFLFCHIKVRPYKGNSFSRMFSIFQFAWRILRNRKIF